MKFQTLSLVVGTKACNAKCPFCISAQTGFDTTDMKEEPINIRNLRKTLELAKIGGVTTVILTGKGEPTLFPEQILTYLTELQRYNFPFIELQTNGGILAMDEYKGTKITDMIKEWYYLGLTTVLISNVGQDAELNRQVYFPKQDKYIDMPALVKKITDAGLNVRLTTVGIRGGVDSWPKLKEFINYAKAVGAKQVTWRPVGKPSEEHAANKDVYNWVLDNCLTQAEKDNIIQEVVKNGTLVFQLVHGAAVYDLFGMNICLTNSLTRDANDETIRQLIFFPKGGLYCDWELRGSVLL